MSVLVRREERSEGGHLAHVTIDNTGKLNSLNRELMIEIVSAVAGLDHDPQLRLALLSGARERAFLCGGLLRGSSSSGDAGPDGDRN